MNKSTITFSLILLLLSSVVGCAYQNRTKIMHLAELNGKIYIATEDGAFKSYDIETNKFKKIATFEGSRITKIIPAKDALIIEATRMKEVKPETHETIYFMTQQENIANSIDVVSGGFKQYDSSLISADDKYVFAIRNELVQSANNKWEFVLSSFRYNKATKDRIENHFNDDLNIIVRDIFEDNNYYWYACYRNPVATHWTTVKGNLVVLRRDKITDEQKSITLGDDVFEKGIYITGDDNNIWVFGENWFKENIFKISIKDFTYQTIRINALTRQIKEIPSENNGAYFWLILSGDNKLSLNRFDKGSLKTTQIPVTDGVISEYRPAVADDKFIWIGQSQLKSFKPGFPDRYSPYLLRISKTDLSSKVVPVETTFGEGMNNVKRSFFGYIATVFFSIFGGPG